MKYKKGFRRFFIFSVAVMFLTFALPPLWEFSEFPPKMPHAQAYTQTFTASSSWQAPEGITSVRIEAWGGGGSGGGRGSSTGVSGGGGGGAYAAKTIAVTPGQAYNYTIGSGGTGGSGAGQDGGATQWDNGSEILAAGGKGGAVNTTKGSGGATTDSEGTTLYEGGDGANGAGSLGGGGGSGAGSGSSGNDASGQTAGTYQNDGGAGGNGGSNSNGLTGSIFGGGGGGAARTSGTRLGGNGAAGAIRINYSSNVSPSMQSGYYIGDGTAGHAISGLGFRPDFVLIKADTNAGAAAFTTGLMPDANMALITATADNTASNLVLNSDGFTLGTSASVNSTGVRYTWTAFAGSDCTASGIFCVGQYIGNGGSTREIDTGFQPDFVMTKRTTAVAAHFHTASQPDNETLYLMNAVRDQTGNFFKTFNSDGFSSGVTDNAASGIYNYVAFKSSANFFNEGTYTGDANDNRDVTGVGFQPDMTLVKNSTNTTASNTTTVMETNNSYGDYSTLLTAAANAVNNVQGLDSDGFQVGTGVLVNGSADTYYWLSFGGTDTPSSSNSFPMRTGSYTGNGASQSISGLGFQPDLVIIKDNAANYQVFRTSLIKGDSTAYLSNAAANFTAGITSLDSDGFSIGSSSVVNTSSNTYQWQAFGGAWNPETKSGSTDFAIGAYMGNGIDSRDITGMPWQPNMVAVKRNSTTAGGWRSSAHSGDLTSSFGATAETANFIEALNSDGFRIGTNAVTNSAGSLYYWFAFKNGSSFNTGSYTGNASDNRNITDVGFQPNLVWVKRSTAVNGVSRSSSLAGDNTQYFANLANASDRIQSLISNGFQVGGNQTETNTNSANYRWVAWKSVPVVSISITSDGSIEYGTVNSNDNKSTLDLSDTQTAKNDGNTSEDLNIKTSAPSTWSLGTTPGTDVFVHEFSTDGGNGWIKFVTADSYQSLASEIESDSSLNFDLRITVPEYSTNTSEKDITVTVQAVQH